MLHRTLCKAGNSLHWLSRLKLSSSAVTAAADSETPKLTLFSRKYCGICEHARDNILSLSHKYSFTLETKDVDAPENKKWKERYNYDVPVLHINEKPAFMHAVPCEDLEKILKELSS